MVKKLETSLITDFTTLPSPTLRLAYVHTIPHTRRQWMAAQAEGARRMDWKTLLAYITGTVDQELLLRNEYLVTENRILRNHIKGRVRLSDGERKTLAEIGQKLGTRSSSFFRLTSPGCSA
jgi:hypothetical protein